MEDWFLFVRVLGMKFIAFPWSLISATLVVFLLPSCGETEAEIQSVVERTAATRVANNKADVELQKMNQQLSLLNREVTAESSKRREFEDRAKKSAATEQLFSKYKAELEVSVADFANAVAAYRQKYLDP